jgi:glutathione S-transferase
MADILRVKKLREALGPYPALQAYTDRILDRPAFRKVLQDQLDHFTAADAARAKA